MIMTTLKVIWKIFTALISLALVLAVFSIVEGRQNQIIVSLLMALYISQNMRDVMFGTTVMGITRALDYEIQRIKWMLGDPKTPEEPESIPPGDIEKNTLKLFVRLIPGWVELMVCAYVLFIGKP